LRNQSLVSNTELHNTSQDSILPKEFSTEGVVPPYNPPLIDPLGPVLIQVAPIPTMSSTVSTSYIPVVTNGSWSFVNNFDPPSLPPLILSNAKMIVYPGI